MTGGGSGTVYVVDDDDAVRDSLVFLLEVEGLRARGFASAAAFLEALPADPRGCVLTDIQMPGPHGAELLHLLPERGIHLPVIVMTGRGETDTSLQMLAAGAFDFIEKPFQDNAVVQRVRAALAAGADPLWAGVGHARSDALARIAGRAHAVLDALIRGEPDTAMGRHAGLPTAEI